MDTLLEYDVIQAVAGHNHSIVLTADGKVFTWGRNDAGALGHGDSYIDIYSMEDFPRIVECKQFQQDRIIQVAAGKGRSAAVSNEGELFVWGRNMGHIPTIVEKSAFDGLKIRKVALGGEAGKSVIAAITEDGGLYTLGDGSSKLLGMKNLSGKQPTPIRVKYFEGMNVLDVYCGPGQHIAVKVEKSS